MAMAFSEITFTPSVKAAQLLYGSREKNSRFETATEVRNELTAMEALFISQRDSFYQATVSENAWPYVQHRGGPVGFLKVLDQQTLGFADFRGNLQYLSVGNLNANKRISLILMDYAQGRRLKIWGNVDIVHESDNPDLIKLLEMPAYRARVERGFIIHVQAYDWNCPQHISPRFSQAEVAQQMAPLLEEIQALRLKIQALEK
ncbi:MAG: pyridoxamine 5'-phosphate oxidase family protein [Methylococcaceae bacterium]|jgi:hypothetical protein